MRRIMPRLALLLLGGLLSGAAGAQPSGDVVARRGDIQLSVNDLKDALRYADPAQRDQLLNNPTALAEFVRERLLRQALLNEARSAAWDQKIDVQARISDARDTILVQTWLASRVPNDPNFPSDADVNAAYEANKARFAVPKQYRVAQIAILVPANAAKEVDDEARRKATDIKAQVTKPKADFADIAKKNSQDKGAADKGGDLGWVREDQIVPAVRDTVRGMSENAISEPIRSAEAWHVIKLLGSKPPSFLPVEQVRETLVNALRQARSQQITKAYLDEMLKKEPPQINEVGLGARIAAPK